MARGAGRRSRARHRRRPAPAAVLAGLRALPSNRRGLDKLAAETPGLVHAELDVAEHPDAARQLSVLRTPTLVAFDRSGAELLRVSGVPRASELASALAPALAS